MCVCESGLCVCVCVRECIVCRLCVFVRVF